MPTISRNPIGNYEKKIPKRPKPDSNGHILFGSLSIRSYALRVEVLRLIDWSLRKMLGRRRRWRRRRIHSSRARFLLFRSMPRRHYSLRIVKKITQLHRQIRRTMHMYVHAEKDIWGKTLFRERSEERESGWRTSSSQSSSQCSIDEYNEKQRRVCEA